MPNEQIANLQYRRWSERRDQASTIMLCCSLAEMGEACPDAMDRTLMFEVGSAAEELFPEDALVLQAVGRMYLAGAELDRALTSLTRSAGIAGRARTFRLLGEALLRLGDAQVAAPMFSRAIKGGEDDAETLGWHATATAYAALQEAEGPAAVAHEIQAALRGRAVPSRPSDNLEHAMPLEPSPIAEDDPACIDRLLSSSVDGLLPSRPVDGPLPASRTLDAPQDLVAEPDDRPLPRFPSATDVSISKAPQPAPPRLAASANRESRKQDDSLPDLTADLEEATDEMSSSGIIAAIQSAVDQVWVDRSREPTAAAQPTAIAPPAQSPAPMPQSPGVQTHESPTESGARLPALDSGVDFDLDREGLSHGEIVTTTQALLSSVPPPPRILPVFFDDTHLVPQAPRRDLPPLVPARPPRSSKRPLLFVLLVVLLLASGVVGVAVATGRL